MPILTSELVKRAIELVRPGIDAILNAEGTTWGPRWVCGTVKGPQDITVHFTFGEFPESEPLSSKASFYNVAQTKLEATEREQLPTSVIVTTKPWLLRGGEYLYPGGTTRDGISVAVSGAKGRTDEAIAEIVLSIVIMLAYLEMEKRIKEDKMQI